MSADLFTDPPPPMARRACIGKDKTCPCQDGDACHYEGADAWPIPESASPPCPLCRCARSGYSGLYNMHCAGCRARDIARGPVAFAARNAAPKDANFEAVMQAYRDALSAAGVLHSQVKEWSA